MFELMTTYSENKEGETLNAISDEMMSCILKNRSQQRTRLARAQLGGKVAFFRNAGTMYCLLGRHELEAARNRNITRQKEIQCTSRKLTCAKFWLQCIDYCQIFDHLVHASLEAQHGTHCASSALSSIIVAIVRIGELGNYHFN